MRKLFRRIPLIIWVIVLSVCSFFVAKQNLFSDLSNEQIRLLSGLLTFIGLIFVAINIQRQWKNERIKTEYLNQPDFNFTGFASDKLFGAKPVLCQNINECKDDHWLNIIQKGNLAARNLKIALFHIEEAESNVSIKERWLHTERLAKDDSFQYKIPPFSIPFKFFNKTTKNCFILLLEYDSEYSNIKYKRAYHLCSSPIQNPTNTAENDWKEKIYFYESSLDLAIDTDSITIKQILINAWFKIVRQLKIKKDYCYNDWLINI
jgi:hypothetical protein